MQITIGVDVGNFDTKSKNTNTVSGYTVYNNEQLLTKEVLIFDGKYYVESIDNRFPFVEDKTENDQCLILTLFSIAKEILWRITNERHMVGDLSDEIRRYDYINLAIGLPPGHFNKLARKTLDYYKEKMKSGLKFTYTGYSFSLQLAHIEVYAQDLTAVIMNQELTITNPNEGSDKYYIIGIGGYTVDIIPIVNGAPDTVNCRSLPLGTRPMFESIIARIQSSIGMTLAERAIEDVLKNKRHFLSPTAVEEIKRNTGLHAEQIINKCIQAGCSLELYPVVYVGGGYLLLEPYLKNNKLICFSEHIKDTHANAATYEAFIKLKHKLTS